MKDGKPKINKSAAVDICAEEIFTHRKSTGDIISFFQDTYGVSRSAVEKWIRAAKPLVEERRQAATQVQRKLDEETLTEMAKKNGITLERIVQEYAKIAFGDIRNCFDVDGGLKNVREWDDLTAGAISSVETQELKIEDLVIGHTRKLKSWDKKGGLDGLCKIFGYTIPKDKEGEKPSTDLGDQPITFK